MKKIIKIGNYHFVKINNYINEYYQLQYKWNENIKFNLNGKKELINIKSRLSFEDFLRHQKQLTGDSSANDYIKFYKERYNNPFRIDMLFNDIYVSSYGQCFEDCENILWKKLKEIEKCNHIWTKEFDDSKILYCKNCNCSKHSY